MFFINRHKFLIFAIGLVGVMMSSCTSDSPEMPASPDESKLAEISFDITTERNLSRDLGTNDSDEDESDFNIICAVYDKKGNLLPELGEAEDGLIHLDVNGLKASLNLTLVKGQEYKLAFWAQKQDCKAYKFGEGIKKVGMKYAEISTIDDRSDAFYKTELFTVVGNEKREICLRRAVANLNIFMSADDKQIIEEKTGIKIGKTQLRMPVMPDGFDLTEEKASVTQEGKDILLNPSLIAESKEETYLLTSTFMFASQESKGYEGFELYLIDADDDTKSLIVTLSEIPLQRNWATNINLSKETVISQYEEKINNN